MKKVVLYIVLISLIIISCKREEINTPIIVYSINKDTPECYILNSKHESEFINFKYVSSENSNLSLEFKYDLDKDYLLMASDTLYSIKSVYKPKDVEFKMYQIRQKRSHIRTLVFNEEYGLLASLSFKSHKLFLKDSISFLEKETIFKELFLQLNKINIE